MTLALHRLLFRAASAGKSGTVEARGSGPRSRATVELDGGWVHALHAPGDAPGVRGGRPEESLRELLRTWAADEAARGDLDESALPIRRGRVTPFHPAVVVRHHVESQLAPDGADTLRARFGPRAEDSPRVRLVYAPHASCLGHDERPLVTLLSVAPNRTRAIAELDGARLTAPQRVARLVLFLEAVGAATVEAPGPSPWEILGVAADTPPVEVRRAYKRLARDLHPDLHPDVPVEDRRRLEERFAAVTAAYRRLLPSE